MTKQQQMELNHFLQYAKHCKYTDVKLGIYSRIGEHQVVIAYKVDNKGLTLHHLIGEYKRLSSATKLFKEVETVLVSGGLI